MSSTAPENTFEIVYPRGRGWSGSTARFLAPALTPAGWLYHGITSAVRKTRELDAGPTPTGVKVISVGNLEVGGSGKTPFVIYLVR